MLMPPSAEWADGPPASAAAAAAAAAQRPEPLPPELEARLRRQRAQQYGRAVRDSLAAANARQAAKREAAAAAHWEAQRAARLARLAERQQVAQPQPGSPPACGTAAAALQHPAGKDGAHACAAGTENTSPAALLRAVEQLDAKLRTATAPRPRIAQGGSRAPAKPDLQRQPAARQAQQPALRQRQAAAGGGAGAKGVAPSAPGPAGHDGARPLQSQAQGTAAAAVPPEPPVDPLEQLLRELLAAEGAGDPYSIINLYVTEQLQQVAAPAPARAGAAALPAGLQPAPETQGEAATATATATAAASTQGAIPSHSPPAVRPAQPEAAAMSQDVQVAAAAAELQPLPRAGLEEAHARELLPLREQQSLKPQPSESAPSTARHRRSSSLMLPQQFDVAAAADPAEWSIAAVGLGEADLPAANLGSGPAAGIPAGAVPPPQAIQCQQSAAAADSVPLDQPSGSKQLYVQQWLQRSAAELAAPESAPTSSSVAYSEDPDQASVQLEALPSLPSPGTDMAAPPAASSTAGKGGMAAAFPDCVAAASAGASPEAAAAAAPSGLSVASRSASAVTSTRRPGAPEPLSSSSQLDGSSSAPSRSRYASVSGTAAPPAALVPPPEEPQLQAPADDLSLGRSSWDGRSGAGSEEQEVQAALSFSQLQAVAVVDGAAGLLPSGGEQPTAVEGSESPCSPASRSSNAPSLGAAPHAHQPAPHPASSHTAATPGAAAALPVTAAAPTVGQSSVPSSDAYSSDFDSDFEDAEISYGVLDSGSTPAPPAVPAAAGPSAAAEQQAPPAAVAMETATADSSRPSSPRVLQPAPWQVGSGSPPGSAGAQPRPRSPHHAALDDRYPGSPPASGGSPALQLPMPGTTYSRPHSPVSLGASPRASGDGGVTSRPTSPCSAALGAAAEAGQPALQQEDTVVVHSPAGSSSSGGNSAGQAGSPYSLVQFGTEPASVAAAQEGAAAAAAAAAVVGSPPGTPVLASPGEDYGSCPGSARVDDDTVVQTEEHNRAYLQEVLDYFLRERAEPFAAGAVPYPLELDGYLAIERRRPACGDPQHIWNKLLFDAANEALAAHYAQAVRSLAGRLAPRVALLDPTLLDRHVTQRVLRWAALGGGNAAAGGTGSQAVSGAGGVADVSALLAEDAAEEERTLGQLVGALHAELAAAASRAASPDPAGAATPASPTAAVGT